MTSAASTVVQGPGAVGMPGMTAASMRPGQPPTGLVRPMQPQHMMPGAQRMPNMPNMPGTFCSVCQVRCADELIVVMRVIADNTRLYVPQLPKHGAFTDCQN